MEFNDAEGFPQLACGKIKHVRSVTEARGFRKHVCNFAL